MPQLDPRLNYADPVNQEKRWPWWVTASVIIFSVLAILILFVAGGIAYWTYQVNPASSPTESKCAANLEIIGQAISLYANHNAGRFPPALSTLVLDQDIDSAVFVCPSITCNDFPASGSTPSMTAGNLQTPGSCSYTYLGARLIAKSTPNNAVIAFESSLSNHGGTGANVLFADGHVVFEPRSWMLSLKVKLTTATSASQPTTMPTE